MKNFFSLLCLALLLCTLSFCKKSENSPKESSRQKPKADFSFTFKNSGSIPAVVDFTSSSTGGTSYLWRFGDGSTSSSANEEHIFSSPGTFKISLIVTNSAGKDSITKDVAITQDKPKAAFTYSVVNAGSYPTKVKFTNSSTGANDAKWAYDGKSNQESSPELSFANQGTFDVKLIVSNASGKDSTTVKVIVPAIQKSLRVFLVTPTDKTFRQDYYNIIKSTALNLQSYYKNNTGNQTTFTLNPLIVETLKGTHNTAWYNSNNGTFSGTDPRFYGYNNTLYEMKELLGEELDLTKYTFLVYVAAPGGGAGSTGFCAMGDQDLDGLLGKNPENLDPNRWIGGCGHEIGHSFGLPHPANENPNALMWTGYTIYPKCILQQEDKNILKANPFFK